MKKTIRVCNLVIFILIFITLITFYPAEENASQIIKLSFKDIVKKSDVIILGKVISKKNIPNKNLPLTETLAKVLDCVKGCDRINAQDSVVIVTLGGKVNGVIVRVNGEAEFEIGEKFIAFLRFQKEKLRVVGMNQGKLKVEKDKKGGKEMVILMGNYHFAKIEGNVDKENPLPQEPMPFEVFWQAVKDEVVIHDTTFSNTSTNSPAKTTFQLKQ